MGLPQENPKAYEQSSAINFAAGPARALDESSTVSGDDNVHFQGF